MWEIFEQPDLWSYLFPIHFQSIHYIIHIESYYFPEQVFDAIVPRTVRLAEAPSYGLPISEYAPDSSGAKAYAALAREVLQGDGIHIPVMEEA